MDENKIYEFMTKIYSEMHEGFKELKTDIKELKMNVKEINAKIDGDLIPTDKAILDGYKSNSEHITVIDDKIDRLQIDVNNISMKTTYNDSRIIEITKDLKKAK